MYYYNDEYMTLHLSKPVELYRVSLMYANFKNYIQEVMGSQDTMQVVTKNTTLTNI